MEREEWETEAMRERVRREEYQSRCGQVEMELAQAKADREQLRDERDREAESAMNLHAVLEEFQAAKERELAATLGDLQDQLRQSTEALHAFKQRAVAAEVSSNPRVGVCWREGLIADGGALGGVIAPQSNLAAAQNDSEKVLSLTKDVKDKNLLIGKLRHEGRLGLDWSLLVIARADRRYRPQL